MIEIKQLNYSIGDKPILINIDLTIEDGEFAAIVGPNGAGKSTLVKIILGLITDYSGTIRIDGKPHQEWLHDNLIGYLPQSERFDRAFPAKAIDIVLMGIAGKIGLGRRFSKQDKLLAVNTMELTGVLQQKNQYIGTLSGGEWQRVLLARALITGANYLFLDEPEASVDRTGVKDFFSLLADLNKQGKTIITISHDLHMLSDYCKHLICLNHTLHCHAETELVSAEILHRTFGDAVHLIEKDY